MTTSEAPLGEREQVALLERTERVGQAEVISRRGMLRIGSAFVATLAALSTTESAWAGNCGSACCSLRTCTLCRPNSGCNGGWVCPSGYQDSWWMCVSGGTTCTCGECTVSTDCYDSRWSGCSYYGCF
jgi:hypothetical protein